MKRIFTLLGVFAATAAMPTWAQLTSDSDTLAIQRSEQKKCIEILALWWADHPKACPLVLEWEEIAPGIDAAVSSKGFDFISRDLTLYHDIVIRNTELELVPANSQLLITDTNTSVLNHDGITDPEGFPYFDTSTDLAIGETLVVRANFSFPRRWLDYSLGFNVAEYSDGTVSISGEAMVTSTLSASLVDPDGVSTAVAYQWLANGVAISGATGSSYTLQESDEGQSISVEARYIDDASFNEIIVSAPTVAIAPRPENVAGQVSISGDAVLGSALIASVADSNGVSGAVEYQWFADGEALEGEADEFLGLSTDLIGKQVSVSATYSDDNWYDESLTSESTAYVATTIVFGEEELVAAVAAATAGDWIGLGDGDYDAMAQLDLDSAITLTTASNSSAVVSGATCIVMNANESGLVALNFSDLDVLVDSSCNSNGDSSVFMYGDSLRLAHNSFNGEVAIPSSTTYNWISVKGSFSLIERNLFQGKDTTLKGAAISMYNNESLGDQYGHVIQYNVFKDFLGETESSAHAIQIGRSTNTSANGLGTHVVRYNRFDNVRTKQRMIKVQSSANSIYGNTVVNSTGNIALENGQNNVVANNVIISGGEDTDSNDSGISFTPYGHSLTGNYIAGLRTTSSQRGALLTNSERAGDTGNSALTPSTVTVANNTIMNSRQAYNFSANSCLPGTFVVNFTGNLVANGEDPTVDLDTDYGLEGKTLNGEGRDVIIDGCALSAESTFENERYYSRDLSKNGTFLQPEGVSFGEQGAADITASTSGLFEGQGVDAGVGADADTLIFIEEELIGPGSDFIASTAQTQYNELVDFDLSTWKITFPSGLEEENPQWLMDRNEVADEFFFGDDGAMTFKTPNISGSTEGSTYPRTELREMLRGPEQDPKPSGWPSTKGLTKNNWVFSTSYQATRYLAGGVDGNMKATLKVDHVSTTGDDSKKGRVIVGQIHASDDEPVRIYYRKLPGNELGSVFFRSEVPGIGDNNYDLIGTSSNTSPNPIDGIALGEIWSYEINMVGLDLTVTVKREGKPDVSKTVQVSPLYNGDWMYFKAGVYNQNNTGDTTDYAQATFYALTKSHDAPPTEPGNGEDEEEDQTDGSGEIIDATSLQTAIITATAGDVIELTDGDYSNMDFIAVNVDGVTITRAEGSNAVISGSTCFYVGGDNVTITGLTFSDLALVTDGTNACRTNGDGNVVLAGDNIQFDNNTFDGDVTMPVPDGETTHNWLVLKGSNAVVERNTFQNKAGFQFDGISEVRGAYITVFSTGNGVENLIQYNLFKDLLLSNESSAYAIQLGRTTGTDSMASGLNTIRYNRFDNIDSKTRVIRVQSSENVIDSNMVVGSQGMISLEDGQNNVVTNNVILPTGEDSNDGGIGFAPYGHTITNNYIAGSKTSSSERGALLLNSNANGSGNQLLTSSAVSVTSNTIINARQPIHFSSKNCGVGPGFIVDFESNLIANGVDGLSETYEGITKTGYPAIVDNCNDAATLSFLGEAYYATGLSLNGTVVFDALNNTLGADSGAVNLKLGQSQLLEWQEETYTGLGADTSMLKVIEETDVGVGSATSF